MSTIAPTPVPALGTDLPDPSDRTTYGTRGRALWDWEVNTLVPSINQLGDAAYANALQSQESALVAVAAANFKGSWASLSGALAVPAAVWHSGRVWALMVGLSNVAASEPGVSGDWVDVGGVKRSGDVMLGPLGLLSGQTGSNARRADETIWNVSGAARIPSLTTAGRPASPSPGDTGFNTTLGDNETWNGAAWVQEHGGKAGPVTAAGTSTSISGIPSWANHVDVVFKKLSTTGNDQVLFRLGSGSIQTTGYESRSTLNYGGGAVSLLGSTAGIVYNLASAVETRTGTLFLKRETGNTWIATISGGGSDHVATSFGLVTLSGALDRVDVAVAAGTFDLGTITAYWRA